MIRKALNFFSTWFLLPGFILCQWGACFYFMIMHNKDLSDLQKFTGTITSIYIQKNSGKSSDYSVLFDFNDYKEIGFINTGPQLSNAEILSRRIQESSLLTVYYYPVLFSSSSKSVNIFQLQSNEQVIYSLKTAKKEYLNLIIIIVLVALVTTLAFIANCYKIFQKRYVAVE